MSSQNNATSSAASERLTGRVKWFNNKAGYGFVTVTDGSRSGSDIFVHHSAIGVSSQQYKYLVQGEYVDFDLSSTPGGAHEFQATNVVGIKGGKLMCETRHEFKLARSTYKTTSDEPVTQRRTTAPRSRGEGPRGESKDWTVAKGKDSKAVSASSPAPTPKGRGRPPKSTSAER